MLTTIADTPTAADELCRLAAELEYRDLTIAAAGQFGCDGARLAKVTAWLGLSDADAAEDFEAVKRLADAEGKRVPVARLAKTSDLVRTALHQLRTARRGVDEQSAREQVEATGADLRALLERDAAARDEIASIRRSCPRLFA
jgi:hypothetical protein